MIIGNLIILLVVIILYLISLRYDRDYINTLDKSQHKLIQLYPLGFYLLDRWPFNRLLFKSDKIEDSLKALYAGEQITNVKRLYICKKVVIILLVFILSDLFAIEYEIKSGKEKQLQDGSYLLRPDYEEGNKKVDLEVQVTEGESILLEDDFPLELEEKTYSKEKLEKLFLFAKDYIDSTILNSNKSPDEVITNLKFIEAIPNTRLKVAWDTGNHEIIDKKGRVNNETIKENQLVWVTANISYGERSEEYTRYLQVLPKAYTEEEKIRINLQEAVNSIVNNKSDDKVILPDSLDQKKVHWREKQKNSGSTLLIFGAIAGILLYLTLDRDLLDKVEKRNREMLLDYPEIINKFTLFVGAGMSVSNAWGKIARDYKDKRVVKRYAYEEILITYNELMVGTTEVTAYERFGRRVKLLPYLRFSSLIAQNIKNGSKDFLSLLEIEAAEAFEERKELAKRMGEEAGTKLLVPMILMLMIVLGIILVPAFLSFQI